MKLPKDKEVRLSIDWLRYTMPMLEGITTRENLGLALPQDDRIAMTGELLPNARGYDTCMALTIGRVHWHSERPEQKISVEFSGDDCNKLHQMSFNFAALWEHIETERGHITTIHFAMDLHNLGADHQELENALQAGDATTRAKKVYTYAGGQIGEGRQEGTTYVGKSSSDRQLRVYNKAAERGVVGDWTRVELVIKGKRAKALLEALRRYSWHIVGRSAIDEFVKWPGCDWWATGVTGKMITLPVVAREDTNTVEWLYNAVLPTLQREILREASEGKDLLAARFSEIIEVTRLKPC